MYYQGRGIKRDYGKAAEWFRKSSDQGYAPAQTSLGYMLSKGLSIKRDYEKALELYRVAAEKGDTLGQNNLGSLYMDGIGNDRNSILAYVWFSLAAAKGNELGIKNKKNISKRMSSLQISIANKIYSTFELLPGIRNIDNRVSRDYNIIKLINDRSAYNIFMKKYENYNDNKFVKMASLEFKKLPKENIKSVKTHVTRQTQSNKNISAYAVCKRIYGTRPIRAYYIDNGKRVRCYTVN